MAVRPSVAAGPVWICCVLALVPGVWSIRTWNMHDYCGRHIVGHGGELYFNAMLLPFGQKSCSVSLTGNDTRETKMSFFFSNFDMGNDCNMTSVSVRDGRVGVQPVKDVPGLGGKLCGTNKYRNINQVFSTSDSHLGLLYEGDGRPPGVNATFTILFTSYMTKDSGCSRYPDVYVCGNGRCIMEELTCQGLNPCGDFTTDCYNSTRIGHTRDNTTTSGMSTIVQIIVFGLISVLGVVFLVQMLMLVKRYGRKRCGSDKHSLDDLTNDHLMNGQGVKSSIEEDCSAANREMVRLPLATNA